MSSSLKILVFLLVAVLPVATAFGYGRHGHQIVGAIADALIKDTPAAEHVKQLLQDGATDADGAVIDSLKDAAIDACTIPK